MILGERIRQSPVDGALIGDYASVGLSILL